MLVFGEIPKVCTSVLFTFYPQEYILKIRASLWFVQERYRWCIEIEVRYTLALPIFHQILSSYD